MRTSASPGHIHGCRTDLPMFDFASVWSVAKSFAAKGAAVVNIYAPASVTWASQGLGIKVTWLDTPRAQVWPELGAAQPKDAPPPRDRRLVALDSPRKVRPKSKAAPAERSTISVHGAPPMPKRPRTAPPRPAPAEPDDGSDSDVSQCPDDNAADTQALATLKGVPGLSKALGPRPQPLRVPYSSSTTGGVPKLVSPASHHHLICPQWPI
jgi:hypothetical protein